MENPNRQIPSLDHDGPPPELPVENRPVPQRGSPGEFFSDLVSALKEPLILILIFLWLLLSGFRLVSASYQGEKAAQGKQSGREMTVYGNFLYMNFFRDQVGAIGQESIDTINRLTLETYRAALTESPDDSKLAERYVMLLCLTGKREEGARFVKEKPDLFKDRPTVEILEQIYLDPAVSAVFFKAPVKKENNLPGVGEKPQITAGNVDELKKLESSVSENLDGWFSDYTLFRIYTITKQNEKLADLQKKIESRASSLLIGLFIVGMFLFIGFLVGPVVLVAAVAATFTKFKNITLSSRNVETVGNPDYAGLTVKGTVLVFLFWEYARFFAGIVNGFLFRATRDVPPPALFISQLLLYGGVILFMTHTIKKDGGSFKGASIGLPPTGAGKTAINLLVGVGTYLAVVPIIIAGSMLYQHFFKQTPQSTNPVFEIIKNAGTPFGRFLIFAVVGILGPIFEEVLFRGYIYTTCRKYMPALLAAPLVAMLFAVIHFDMNVLFQLFLLGLLLGVIYERTGSLIPAIVTHCIWNSVVFFISITLLG